MRDKKKQMNLSKFAETKHLGMFVIHNSYYLFDKDEINPILDLLSPAISRTKKETSLPPVISQDWDLL